MRRFTFVSELRERERRQKDRVTELASVTDGPTLTPDVASKIRTDALTWLESWRELLLSKQSGVTRSLVRKLLDEKSRFVFYPQMSEAGERRYEAGVTPS